MLLALDLLSASTAYHCLKSTIDVTKDVRDVLSTILSVKNSFSHEEKNNCAGLIEDGQSRYASIYSPVDLAVLYALSVAFVLLLFKSLASLLLKMDKYLQTTFPADGVHLVSMHDTVKASASSNQSFRAALLISG